MTTVKKALESAIEAMNTCEFNLDYSELEEHFYSYDEGKVKEALEACKSALAELESVEPVAYHDVLNALVGMCFQYLTMPDGKLNHSFMSAGEDALEVLEKLGLITGEFGEIIPEALDEGWIKNKFINKPQTREWVGLTNEHRAEILDEWDRDSIWVLAKSIEAKLRELNTKG